MKMFLSAIVGLVLGVQAQAQCLHVHPAHTAAHCGPRIALTIQPFPCFGVTVQRPGYLAYYRDGFRQHGFRVFCPLSPAFYGPVFYPPVQVNVP